MTMKLRIATTFAALVLAVSAQAQSVTAIEQNLRFCESTLPYDGGILIANFGTQDLNPLNTEGKGYIVFWKNGKSNVLVPADGRLSAPKGMFERNGRLFICDVNKLVVYDLRKNGMKPRVIDMPQGNLFVNDLAADGNTLYISVTNTDKIFTLDISNLDRLGKPVEWLTVPGPNGLVIRNGEMWVASYPADGNTTDKHVVYHIADLAKPEAKPFITVSGQYDGIAFSSDGKYLYLTNWSPAGLSRINMKTRQINPDVIILDNPLVGPADISVTNGSIFIPDLPNSRVIVIPE